MISATTGQFSLPASIRNPLSEAPGSRNLESEKGSPASELANRKAGASEPQNRKDSASEPLNPFANLPSQPFTPTPFPAPFPFPGAVIPGPPVPEPPLRVDPETDALLQQGASDQSGASGTSDLTIASEFFNPDGNGPLPGNGGDLSIPRPSPVPSEFIDSLPGQSPFNPDPRPFVPSESTPIPFPFPGVVRPGPPVPAPPLTPPPGEDAALQASGQNADVFSAAPGLADEALNIDGDEPVLDSFGERIPFEPNGIPPDADFFTDALARTGAPVGGQELADNARIQAGGGTPSVSAPAVQDNTGANLTAGSDGNFRSALERFTSRLESLISNLMNMLKLG